MIKKVIFIVILVVTLGFFYSLGRQIYDSLQVGQRLDIEIESLTNLQKKNADLKKKLAEVQTPEFIEQQARDKLNLAKGGETVVIIPQKELDRVLGLEKEVTTKVIPYWQGWLRLFFH